MADFITTETNVIRNGGNSPATIKIYGTYVSSAGATGGVIQPGYTISGGTQTASTIAASAGARKILSCVLTPALSDVTAPGGVIAYDTTNDRDKFTAITTVDTGGTYCMECLDNGN